MRIHQSCLPGSVGAARHTVGAGGGSVDRYYLKSPFLDPVAYLEALEWLTYLPAKRPVALLPAVSRERQRQAELGRGGHRRGLAWARFHGCRT